MAKKRYSKKFICEALRYWRKQLRALNEGGEVAEYCQISCREFVEQGLVVVQRASAITSSQQLDQWFWEKDPTIFAECPISEGAPHTGNVVHRLLVAWDRYQYSTEDAIYVLRALLALKTAVNNSDYRPSSFSDFKSSAQRCMQHFGVGPLNESDDFLSEADGQANCEITFGGNVMTPPIGSFLDLAAYVQSECGVSDDDVLDYNGQTAYLFDQESLADVLRAMSIAAQSSYGTASAVIRDESTGDQTDIQFDFF